MGTEGTKTPGDPRPSFLRGPVTLRHKLTLVSTLVIGMAITIAGGVFIADGWRSFRLRLLADLTVQAEMLAHNCSAALAFDDPGDARQLLAALRVREPVRAAAVYRADGSLLARYLRDPHELLPETSRAAQTGRWGSDGLLEVHKPVWLEGRLTGTVYLRSDLSELKRWLHRSLALVTVIVLLACGLAVPLATRLLRFVSTPLLALTEVARKISRGHDFTVRAIKVSEDEIGTLTECFNDMLDHIEQRDGKLRESELSHRAIFNGVNEAIIIHAPDTGAIVDVNEAMLRLYGCSHEQAMQLTLSDISEGEPPYSRREARARIRAAVDGEAQLFEWRAKTLAGDVLWTEVTLRSAEICGVTRVLAVVRDISDRKSLEQQLLQAQTAEAIGTLAGGLAHDFNNVLMAIAGHCELALASQPQKPAVREALAQIDNAWRRASDVVRQMQTLNRRAQPELRIGPIAATVRDALKLVRVLLPTTIEVHEEITASRFARADPTWIHQLVMNLCTNAYHAMQRSGGVLRVTLEDRDLDERAAARLVGLKAGPHMRLVVSDTGCGMTAETLEHIFDPYFTTKEVGKGTGLGLAVVHGIVKDLGGAITVSSRPGEGTELVVFLPAAVEHVRASSLGASQRQDMPRGTERVLVLDDDPVVAELCGSVLGSLGYRVQVETRVEDALRSYRLRPERYDAVVTDMVMPQKTGIEVASEMLATRPELPILLVSGHSESLTDEVVAGSGIRALLMKPFANSVLAKSLREALDSPPNKLTK